MGLGWTWCAQIYLISVNIHSVSACMCGNLFALPFLLMDAKVPLCACILTCMSNQLIAYRFACLTSELYHVQAKLTSVSLYGVFCLAFSAISPIVLLQELMNMGDFFTSCDHVLTCVSPCRFQLILRLVKLL